jgi:ADP-ribose pyrophosphatase YjhB (NUDIX family)
MAGAHRNPVPTVDILIETRPGTVVLIRRRHEPHGWAIPGGFVDYGESLEAAAGREAREETGLEVRLVRQVHSYSDPSRDPRLHTISTVFHAVAEGTPRGRDDACEAIVVTRHELPEPLVFDHARILADWFDGRY